MTQSRPPTSRRLRSLLSGGKGFVSTFAISHRRRPGDVERETLIAEVLAEVQGGMGDVAGHRGRQKIRQVQVRRSGRIVVHASTGAKDAHNILVKISPNAQVERRDQRNAAALQRIHESNVVPQKFKMLVPRHLTLGRCFSKPYFIEEAIDGKTGYPFRVGILSWVWRSKAARRGLTASMTRQLCDAFTTFHLATANHVTVSDVDLLPVRQAIDSVRSHFGSPEHSGLYDSIGEFLERQLHGRCLPMVWSHGDASVNNSLWDRMGAIRGIIDWETFQERGLPLGDLVNLCIGQRKFSGCETPWASLEQALTGQYAAFFQPMHIDRYLTALGLDPALIPGLALAAWIQYAAHRLPIRGNDANWEDKTIHKILAICADIL